MNPELRFEWMMNCYGGLNLQRDPTPAAYRAEIRDLAEALSEATEGIDCGDCVYFEQHDTWPGYWCAQMNDHPRHRCSLYSYYGHKEEVLCPE